MACGTGGNLAAYIAYPCGKPANCRGRHFLESDFRTIVGDFMGVTGIDGVTGYSETRIRPSLNQVYNGSLILAVK